MRDTVPERLITTHLVMTAPVRRFDIGPLPTGLSIDVTAFENVQDYRALYRAVGEAWHWRDRLLMSDAELAEALATAEVNVLRVDGAVAGYVELAPVDDETLEIAFFGLLPAYFGRGLGKYLLAYGINRAWEKGAARLTVHTCNLDGPTALANYQARGFAVSHVEDIPMPERYR